MVTDQSTRHSTGVLTRWTVATPLTIWQAQRVARYGLLQRHKSSPPERKAVIVGMTGPGVRLARTLSSDPLLRTQVLGFFEDRQLGDPARVATGDRYQILGKSADVPRFVPEARVSVVYIALP